MKTYIAPEIETIEMATCSVIADSPKRDLEVQKSEQVTDDEVSFSTSAKRDDIWKYMEQ
jgi:hypothetical protein